MKLLLILIICLFNVAPSLQANSFFQLSKFALGLWQHFKLTPTTILTCWNNNTATTLINGFKVSQSLSEAIVNNHKADVNEYSNQLKSIYSSIKSQVDCSVNSQDMFRLYDAMGIKTRNFSVVMTFLDEYFPAHIIDWATQMQQVLQLINNNQFYQAGGATGPIIYQAKLNATHCQSSGVHLQAFMNGIFYQLNQTLPDQINNCFNDTTAYVEIAYLYSWFSSVASSDVNSAVTNTLNFFKNSGSKLQQKIPEKVQECIKDSPDVKTLEGVIGSIYDSNQFNSSFVSYIQQETSSYYQKMNVSLHLFEEDNFWQTGEVLADILYSTKKYRKEENSNKYEFILN